MEAVSRYKRVIKDIATVYGLFLCYKNTTPTHYKQLISGWGIDELCTLLGEVEAINIEEIKQELFSLDGEPLKRFVKDLREYIPNYGAVIESLKSDELLAILEKIHGSKKAHLITDNLTAIAMTAITKIGNVALILSELQPQEQPQRQAPQEPSTEREVPSELDTEQARKYFSRAVEAGLMTEQFEWLATQAQLGYFCLKVFENPRPINSLETFFEVKKLSSSITQASYEARRADVKKWRAKQDKEIFFD